jgi:hypothetical protein
MDDEINVEFIDECDTAAGEAGTDADAVSVR